jgi:hypothetical protein
MPSPFARVPFGGAGGFGVAPMAGSLGIVPARFTRMASASGAS